MRLIDADALRIGKANPDAFEEKAFAVGWNTAIKIIESAPTVEPVYLHVPTKSEFKRMAVQMGYAPVVRCKDCKYYKPDEYEFGCGCDGGLLYVKADDDFCSYGERITNNG